MPTGAPKTDKAYLNNATGVENIKNALAGAKTVIWNGPMGVFEMEPFAKVHPGVLCAADIIEPGIPKAKKLLEENKLPITDENIFIVGALNTKGGNKGIDFLKGNRKIGVPKKDPNAAVAPKAAPAAPAVNTAGMTVKGSNTYRIGLNGQSWDVQVSTLK